MIKSRKYFVSEFDINFEYQKVVNKMHDIDFCNI